MKTAAHSAGRRRQKVRWHLHDLIDLEYFLSSDEDGEGPETDSDRSARAIYLSRLVPMAGGGGEPQEHRRLIRGWLEVRREQEDGPFPGTVFKEIRRLVLFVAAGLGLFSGTGLAMSLLHYSGTRPLNVSVFLGTTVFSQMVLLLTLATIFCLRAAGGSLVRDSVLARLLGRVLTTAALKARRHALKHIEGARRDAIVAAAGLLRGRRRVYGSLFFLPVFAAVQVFALSFNIGLLLATLAKLTGADMAFGWQSTFQVSSRAVYRIVEVLSLPWRPFVPESLAHPSLAQIEGSRMILKEGIYHLATRNLVSWWPFLCLAILCYGLIPRLILLTSAIIAQRRALSRLRFDHGVCDALVRRMLSPVVRTAGTPAAAAPPAPPLVGEAPAEAAAPDSGRHGRPVIALVPGDIFDASRGLGAVAARELSLRVTDRRRIGADPFGDRAVMESLPDGTDSAQRPGVLVLQEAWQPPIQETLLLLKNLRRRLGPAAAILVGLVGKPDPDTIFTPVGEMDWRIWKRRINSLGDPYLRLERLGEHGP